MTSSSSGSALLRTPLTLLLLSVALFTFLIQSGGMGTSDTEHRLQVAHSWWTGEPEVALQEYPDFGLHGRNGKLHAWFGIGQSLVLLPFDIVATEFEKLPFFREYADSGASPSVRTIVISFAVNILINTLTALFAYRLLLLMDFSLSEAVIGTLALLSATTHFYYAQNMQENNYIFLLSLGGFFYQLKWTRSYVRSGDNAVSRKALLAGSAALGLNLLTRLTTLLDLALAGAMIAIILWHELKPQGLRVLLTGVGHYLRVAVPVVAGFLFLDRLYQFARFGSWTNTYVDIFSADQKRLDPSLPSTFPFNGHWFQGGLKSGILGPLFSPSKSVFLFDPLLIVTIVLLVLLWSRLSITVRAFGLAMPSLLAAYIVFYARYFWWSGDFSWGDRYVSSAVEFACLLGVPLLLKYWRIMGRGVRMACAGVSIGSLILQIFSIAFWLPLEIYQVMGRSGASWIQWLRIKNVLAYFIVQFGGQRPAWAPPLPVIDDQWDYLQITTWNLLPSLLRHTGEAPMWVVFALEGLWSLVAIVLIWTLVRLHKSIDHFRVAGF